MRWPKWFRRKRNTLVMNCTKDFENSLSPIGLIAARMGWRAGDTVPFDFIAAYKDPASAIVFVVQGGEPTTIEDDAGLFPSDALVSKLRLLLR